MRIKKNRIDLSEWIIHFVHDRNNDERPEWIINPSSFGFGEDGQEHVDEHLMAIERECENMNFDIKEDDQISAFEVLKLILSMGYIRAGFSYRKKNKSIYGDRPSICFTEMPLHALIQYAKNRSQFNLTSSYAIAFPRNELFNAGARNVIYGLSGPSELAKEDDPYYDLWHKNLSSNCGLGIHEQYRFVYTKLYGNKITDWTHEREWRLACDYGNHCKVGLNFLVEDDENSPMISFSEIVIIVNTEEESKILLKDLAQYYRGDIFAYSAKMVERIKIISLEQLNLIPELNLKQVTIENIDYKAFKNHIKTESSNTEQKQVIQFLQEAVDYADEIHSQEWEKWGLKGLKKESNGDYLDYCAYVHIVIDEPNKPFSNALIDLGYAQSNGNWGIILTNIKRPPTQSQMIKEFYCNNVIKKLSELTGESFSIHIKPD